MTAVELRELLRGLPVERLQNFLARHPVALAILADNYLPMDPSDPTLTRLWEVVGPVSDDGQVDTIGNIAGIRDYWNGLSPPTLEAVKDALPGNALQRFVSGKLLEGLFSDRSQGLVMDLRLRD